MLKPMKSVAKSVLSATGFINDVSPRPFIQRILAGNDMVAADVGAAGWLPPHWQSLEGGLHFLFFEPHPGSYRKLTERVQRSAYPESISVLQTALSGTGGKRTLHMLNTPTGSSLLPINLESEFVDPEDSYIFPITEEDVDTRTLADVLMEQDESLHMLKLDVQGAEVEILEGLGQSRRKDLVMVEAEVNMTGGGYVGCPTFDEIKEILTAADLRLYDVNVVRTYRKHKGNKFWYHDNVFGVYHRSPSISGRVWEFDVMYFKDYLKLMERGELVQLRQLLVALCGYRFFSEAYFIVEKCSADGVFDKQECDALKDAIVRWHDGAAKRFWYGRGKFAQLCRGLLGKS